MAESLDAAKLAPVALTSHSSESEAGVTVTRHRKARNVDYGKFAELRGVHLEQYRDSPRLETRVSISE